MKEEEKEEQGEEEKPLATGDAGQSADVIFENTERKTKKKTALQAAQWLQYCNV